MGKFFIITVDTEGDNLWRYKGGNIATGNVKFIPRFQQLCEKYDYKPVYLTNYEMILSDDYCSFAKNAVERNNCEVGIHVHAWNNPPYYPIPHNHNQNSYLIEYPYDVRRQKFGTLYNLIKNRVGVEPVSHRAGRWAMDNDYFKLLEEFNILVDCSVTPFVNWSNYPGESINHGTDYTHAEKNTHKIGNILEVPVSVRRKHYIIDGSFKHRVKTAILGHSIWLRPAMSSLEEMKFLIKEIAKEQNNDYVEFMIHSSELMPDGSPYFRTGSSIDNLYGIMDSLFQFAYNLGYRGITLKDYCEYKKNQI